jgi:hypothetical protein
LPTENIIFYLDVASKFIKKDQLTKGLEVFLKEKLKVNPDSKFGLFYFNNKGDPVFISDIPDPKLIEKRLDEEWKNRETGTSNLENGLFFCLSELTSKAQRAEGSYRVIVLSDIPSQKNAEYTEAVMALVESVRNLPTFIDIIRLGNERLYKDDVKLRLISTITNGGLFYVNNPKALESTMRGLVKNKTLPDIMEGQNQVIDAEQKKYWLRLAVEMIPSSTGTPRQCTLCQTAICGYCNSSEDIPLLCPNCGNPYHECCAAMHAWNKNVGLKHIFRCVKCGLLLRIDERTVFAINQTPFEDELQDVTPDVEVADSNEETWSPPTEEVEYNQEAKYEPPPIENSEIIPENPPQGSGQPEPEKARIVGFGLFGPKIVRKSSSPSPEGMASLESIPSPTMPEPIAESTESPLERRRRKRAEAGGDVVILCPVCSKYVKKTPTTYTCPNCNSPI